MNSHTVEKKSDPKELEKLISSILVVNNSKLKPYIELFENYPENIMFQSLGTLLGFFKINDKSEDSAYIVNFLSSVIKKEYFINHKRPVSESFDSALHKVNLALAEIAKNGNIRWIGQMDAAICILEKNIFHFTVCGMAKILLLRNQILSDISKDLNPKELEPNPVKTFSNVSSGYLEKDDKIIITSNELFDIFSLNELKKGALRFDQEKFVQFLKTAMINELSLSSTIIIDINESPLKKETKKSKTEISEKEINPFDSKAFEKPFSFPQDTVPPSQNDAENEYTDAKTGHIYVQGESNVLKENSFWGNFETFLGEKATDFSYWLKNKLKKIRLAAKQSGLWLKERVVLGKVKLTQKMKERRKKEQERQETGKEIKTEEMRTEIETRPNDVVKTFGKPNKIWLLTKGATEKLKNLKWPKDLLIKFKKALAIIFPAFSRIKSSFLSLNYHQRLYALLTLVVIIVAPLLLLKLRSATEDQPKIEPIPQISERDIILQDKNIQEIFPEPSTINSPNLKKIMILNDLIFALSSEEIVYATEADNIERFSLPDGFGTFSLAAPMEDLNLILILSDNGRLISFSPVSKKFQENNLVLPENRKIEGVGTYLTYLYLADSINNQIYRYPRSAGGFGSKIDWLKDSMDLKNLSDMAIEENIFVAQNNQIVKLFQGKRRDFNPDQTATSLSVDKIFTNRKVSNLYILDSKNGRVAKYTKDGLLLNQYYSEKLIGAFDFAVDEKNNRVFFANSEGLSSFKM